MKHLQFHLYHIVPEIPLLRRFPSALKTGKSIHNCHLFFLLIEISRHPYVVLASAFTGYLGQYEMVIIEVAMEQKAVLNQACLLYTSDAADE